MKRMKKLISVLLVLVMLIPLVPLEAMAADDYVFVGEVKLPRGEILPKKKQSLIIFQVWLPEFLKAQWADNCHESNYYESEVINDAESNNHMCNCSFTCFLRYFPYLLQDGKV